MSHASIDALLSPTLKHLRERWWDDEFTEFLTETLRPRAGNRILDVGCGAGAAEVSIGRLHVSQIRLYGLDLKVEEVVMAARETASHNHPARFAAGDACRLPFQSGSFDSTYCVAVLQHIVDVATAVSEMVRVTRAGGRVVAVEPDNSARYFFSSAPAGMEAFDLRGRFFHALMASRGELAEPAIGPKLPALFAGQDVDVHDVRLFPVSHARVGVPSVEVWQERNTSIERAIEQAMSPQLRALGREYLEALRVYQREATRAGASFVEIQNTMLFATVGQKGS
jgi:SAM-dependent methyltransferase